MVGKKVKRLRGQKIIEEGRGGDREREREKEGEKGNCKENEESDAFSN